MIRIANGAQVSWGRQIGTVTGYSAGQYRVSTFVNGNYVYEWWPDHAVALYVEPLKKRPVGGGSIPPPTHRTKG